MSLGDFCVFFSLSLTLSLLISFFLSYFFSFPLQIPVIPGLRVLLLMNYYILLEQLFLFTYTYLLYRLITRYNDITLAYVNATTQRFSDYVMFEPK